MIKNKSISTKWNTVVKTEVEQPFNEKTIGSEQIYERKSRQLRRDIVELCDGKQALREVVEHPGGVVILPWTINKTSMRSVQFRYPFMKEMLEAPAESSSAEKTHMTAP
jgi:ADP-ribose pyrophosphatase